MDRKLFFLICLKTISTRKRLLTRGRRNYFFILLKLLRKTNFQQTSNTLNLDRISCERRYWMIDYGQDWFENLWESRYLQIYCEFWKREFRLNIETFKFIVDLLRPYIKRKDLNFRHALPVHKRVAVALWKLATGNSYRTTSKVFGVGLSTACKLHNEFCSTLCQLAPQFIKFPTNGRETATEIEKFKIFSKCKYLK